MENEKCDRVQIGFIRAEKITKRYGKSFYFASLFLSEDKRNSAYSIYSICRLSDEATDKDASLRELSTAKRNIDSIYEGKEQTNCILVAFKQTIEEYNMPRYYFQELIDGMYMDFNISRYTNFKDLEIYCHKVAGVVGLMMLKIFGYNNKEAEQYSAKLGIAMQLTNIIRDIKEDYARGRIYLPQDEMATFGITEEDIKKGNLTPAFKEFLAFQINRAREYYRESEKGFKMITNARCRFVAMVMKEIYAGILDAIEKNNYDIFTKRAYVNLFGKFIITFKVWKNFRKSE